MKNPLWQLGTGFVLSIAVLTLGGCGGTGQTVYLDIVPKLQPGPLVKSEPVKVVIEPFEDRRVEKSRVGTRTHLWGGATFFNVSGDKPGEVYAQAFAERLRTRGWGNRSWNVRVAPAGTVNDADIVITGQIFEFAANAKSRLFSTYITASSKLTISANNKVDGTSTIRSLEGEQSDTVFWFNESDVQRLLTETLQDTIVRYITDTNISKGALRPVR
ncbi:hypothetical protein [Petrachloros mirabilis]